MNNEEYGWRIELFGGPHDGLIWDLEPNNRIGFLLRMPLDFETIDCLCISSFALYEVVSRGRADFVSVKID